MRWSNANAIYQIYPRSFFDSSGDGVGDLAGITSKLPYIKGGQSSLGIDAIWISPFYVSPMADFGYDVSNHTDVDSLFGTIKDFDALLAAAHERDILVMLDFVPNHTSDQHRWFQQALTDRGNKYRQYYCFRDPAPGGGPPNNWLSVFGGSAWQYDEPSGQYYLHTFLPEQPDLNWDNPEVRREMSQVLRFWLDRGVDGFRFDAVRWLSKDPSFRDDLPNPHFDKDGDPYFSLIHRYSRYGDRLDQYLKELTDTVDEYDNKIVIFEHSRDDLLPADEQAKRLYDIDGDSSFPINLEPIDLDWRPQVFYANIADYQRSKIPEADIVMCIGSHDSSRVVTRLGGKRARLMSLIQLTVPGLPIVYYGDEIGMTDQVIHPGDVQDPLEKNVSGKGLGRDPQRTPMQWGDGKNAGFSVAEKTWLPTPPDVGGITVEAQRGDESSLLQLYRRLLKLRSQYGALRKGVYEPILIGKEVYWCTVSDNTTTFGVVVNFSEEERSVLVQQPFEIMLSAASQATATANTLSLPPLEGALIRLL